MRLSRSLVLGAFVLSGAVACGDFPTFDETSGSLTATVSVARIETTEGRALPAGAAPVVATGGVKPITYTSSALPAGVVLNSVTGALTGTPPQSGNIPVSVTVTDKNQNSKTANFTLVVNARPTATVDATLSDKPCTQGAACSYAPITVALGTAPLSVTVAPALPAGLSPTVSAGRVTIAGTPSGAVARTSYTLTVTDAVGATNTATFQLTINPTLVLAPGDTAYQCTTGVSCAIVPATAAGGSPPLGFTITPALPAPLLLNTGTGAISGTPATALPRTVFRVAVTDAASATASRDFALTINAPVTATVVTAVVASTLNHPFATAFPTGIRPVTGAGGSGVLTYTITPALRAGLAFDAATGAITGTPTVVGSTAHVVRVTDSRSAFAEAPFTLAIAPALSATALAPRVCTQAAACTFTPVTATGGTGALSYVIVTPPALPTGLQLVGATGAVTGTPSVSTGAVTYTVRVVDVVGASVTQPFTLTVNPPLVATLGASAYACTVSAPCAFTAVTASAGTPPYGFSIIPALPAGLSLSQTTGAVSGEAAAASAVTQYTITVTDAAGATASQAFTFGVNGPITATVATPAVTSTAGVSFATAFPAGMRPVQGSGGTGALTYTITPALPAALAFAPQTGAITGTPGAAAATATYTVTISDNAGASLARTFTLTINAAITPTVAVPAVQCTQGAACTATPVTVGSGGTAPFTFSIAPALPTGLSYSAAGAISGTTSLVQAATPYVVTVRDAVGATAPTATFTLTINAALTTTQAVAEVGCSDVGGCLPGSPFTPVTASSGTLPYGFAVSPSLPAGFTLNTTTGAITAAASLTGLAPTTYTVTVTDAAGTTSSKTFVLSVLQTTLAVPTQFCTVGAACSFTPVTRTGGKPAVAFSISGPDAATLTGVGLSFNATTGAFSGPPTGVLSATTIAVTATDALGRTSSKTFSLTINAALTTAQAIAEVGCSDVGGCTPGSPFTPVTASNGTVPYGFAVSPALPTGITLNTTTGAITAAASLTGLAPTTYTITVTDAAAATSSKTFVLSVLQTTLAVPTQTCTVGAACSFIPVLPTGGKPTVTFAISGADDATLTGVGLTFSTVTGAISGTPTGTLSATSIAVTATDALGRTSTKTFSITVN